MELRLETDPTRRSRALIRCGTPVRRHAGGSIRIGKRWNALGSRRGIHPRRGSIHHVLLQFEIVSPLRRGPRAPEAGQGDTSHSRGREDAPRRAAGSR